jgi:hypothetical protein
LVSSDRLRDAPRVFVMKPDFPQPAGSCDNRTRATLDPPLPAAGGLFDRRPRVRPVGDKHGFNHSGHGFDG